jgi:hypothetical protein
MKKRLWILPVALIAVAGLFMTGCEQLGFEQMGSDYTDMAEPLNGNGCVPDTFDIWAGQHYDAGDVLVWNCTSYVIVEIRTHDPWVMTESHLAWADNCANLPRNKKGHLVPGHFPFQTTHNPPVTAYTYYIPMGNMQVGDTIALAFHCVVWRDSINEETGWGGSWKGCFKFVIKKCDLKDVKLPTYPIQMRASYPWPDSNAFFKVQLAGIDDTTEYNVWNGYWRGWCSEAQVEIPEDSWITVTLLSSQAESLPYRVMYGEYGLRRWDCVNWLLNNKPDSANYYHIQSAMYYLLRETETKPGGLAGEMATNAITYGTGFKAKPGDWVAVILLTPRDIQLCFIEVDP